MCGQDPGCQDAESYKKEDGEKEDRDGTQHQQQHTSRQDQDQHHPRPTSTTNFNSNGLLSLYAKASVFFSDGAPVSSNCLLLP